MKYTFNPFTGNFDATTEGVPGGGAVDSVNGQTGVVNLDSDDIPQGLTNLYFDQATFDSYFSAKNSDDLAEGSTNLYFTNARAQTAVSGLYVGLSGNETVNGVKTFTSFPVGPNSNPVSDLQLVNKQYVDDAVVSSIFRQGFVIAVNLNTPPGSPTLGDRYVIGTSPTGAWAGQAKNIAEWNGSSWDFTVPAVDWSVTIESSGVQWIYNQSLVWVPFGVSPIVTASNGLSLVGQDARLGGTLTQTTTINQGSFNLQINLDGTGDFIVQDAGSAVFQVDDTGFTRVGTTTSGLGQLTVVPTATANRALVIAPNAGQTANLVETRLPGSVAVQNAITSDSRVAITHTSVDRVSTLFDINQTPITYNIHTGSAATLAMTTRFIAFSYTPVANQTIQTISHFLRSSGTFTNPTTTMQFRMRENTAGAPGAIFTGSTTQTQRIGGLTTSHTQTYGLLTSTGITLVAGTTYWFTIELGAIPTGANVELQGTASGSYYTSTNGTSWTLQTGFTLRSNLFSRVGRSFSIDNSFGNAGVFLRNNVAPIVLEIRSINGTPANFQSTYGTSMVGQSTFGSGMSGITESGTAINGTSTSGTAISAVTTSGTGVIATSTTGLGANITTTDGEGMYLTANPTTVDTIHNLVRWRRQTSGTAAAGIGLRHGYYIETTTGALDESHREDYSYSTATGGALNSQIQWWTRNSNTLAVRMTLASNGALTVTGPLSATNVSGTNTGDQTITLTGDVTGSGTGSFAATLANTAVTPGSYGSASQVGTFTVDSKGRLTAASNTAIAVTSSAISDFNEAAQDAVGGILTDTSSVDFTYNDAGNQITATVLPGGVDHDALLNFVSNEHIDHSLVTISAGTGLSGGGDLTANRTISLGNTAVTPGSYGTATQVGTFTVDAQGRITAASNTTISGTEPGGSAGGDLTGSYPTPTIASDAVTFAKMQNIASNRLLGRHNAGSGDIEEISIGSGLTLSSGTLSATGGGSGTVTSVDLSSSTLSVSGGPITSSGSITVDLFQALDVTDSPTFNNLTLDGYPWIDPSDEYYFSDITLFEFGRDDLNTALDGTPAGLYWSNFDTGDGRIEARTQAASYLNFAAGTITATVGLQGDGAGITNIAPANLSGNVPLNKGGTNANLTASNGGIFYSTSSAGAILAGTATAGQILRSGSSSAPSWSTATYPASTTANRILFSSANNVIGEITSAATSALVTNSSSVPSFVSGTTSNRVLRTNGTAISFDQVALSTDVTGTLAVANGGTNLSTIAAGSVLAANAANTISAVTSASGLRVLQNNAGTVSWVLPTGTGSPVYNTAPDLSATTIDTNIDYGQSDINILKIGSDPFAYLDGSALLIKWSNLDTGDGALKFTTELGTMLSIYSGTIVAQGPVFCTGVAASNSTSGGTVTNNVTNSSNTANSAAAQLVQVGGTSAGDPYTRYIIPSGLTWSIGADNSESDSFVISRNATLGTNNAISIDPSNNVNVVSALGVNTAVPTTALHVTTSTISNGGIIGNSFVGNWNASSTTAVFTNSAFRTTANSYALVQNNSGATNINAATGQTITLSINNATSTPPLHVDSSSRVFSGATAITSNVTHQFSTTNSADPSLLAERSGATTSANLAGLRVRGRSTLDMIDGFSGGLVFSIQDNANTNNDVVYLAGARSNNNDATGDFVVWTYNNAVATEKLRVDYLGETSCVANFYAGKNFDVVFDDITILKFGRDPNGLYASQPFRMKWSNADTGNSRVEFDNGTDGNYLSLGVAGISAANVVSTGSVSTNSDLQSVRSSSGRNLILQSSLGGTSVNRQTQLYRTTTTNATVTTMATINAPTGQGGAVEVLVYARRTGGSSGTAGDYGVYQRTVAVRNEGGTVTVNGGATAVDITAIYENQAGWAVDVIQSGTSFLVRVTGATNNNITWHGEIKYGFLAS